MNSCCSAFTCVADQQFSAKVARGDLERYRRKGPNPSTRVLRDHLLPVLPSDAKLLDVGAGIGALTFELLASTKGTGTLVDASSAYLDAAGDEIHQRGWESRLTRVHGNFVDVAPGLPAADVVTMDRVVCCYREYEPLLDAALSRAHRIFAQSYPRDRWFVRAAISIENGLHRLQRHPFRAYVHPWREMHAIAMRHGFRLCAEGRTRVWQIEVWMRSDGTPGFKG